MTAAERSTLEQLRQENRALRAQVAALEQTVRDLLDQIRQLQEKLDEQARASARQAAPFRRRESRKVPEGSKKRPGRPKGHPGVHRAVPDHIDEHVDVPLTACPHCGGAVTAVEPVEQFIEEIPRPGPTSRTWSRTGAAAPPAARCTAPTHCRPRRPPARPRRSSAPAPTPWPPR